MSQAGGGGGGGTPGNQGGARQSRTREISLRDLLTADKQALRAYAEFMSPLRVFYSFITPALSMIFVAIGAFPLTFGYSVAIIPVLVLIALPTLVLALIATFTSPLLRVAANVEIRRGPVVILRPLYDVAILLTIGLPYALVWWWTGRLITLFFMILNAIITGAPPPGLQPSSVSMPSMIIISHNFASVFVNALIVSNSTKPFFSMQVFGINFTQWLQSIEQWMSGFFSSIVSKVNTCISAGGKPMNPQADMAFGFAIEFFVIAGGYLLSRSRVIRGLGPLNFVAGTAVISTIVASILIFYALIGSAWNCVYSVFTGSSITTMFDMGDYINAINDAGALGALILIYFIGQSLVKSMPGFPRRIPLSWNIVIMLISLSAFAGTIWYAYAMVLVAIYLTFLWLASGDSTWFWYMVVLVPSAYFINLYLATMSAYLISLFSSANWLITLFVDASAAVFIVAIIAFVVLTVMLLLPSLATTVSGLNPLGGGVAAAIIVIVSLLITLPGGLYSAIAPTARIITGNIANAYQLLTSPTITP